MFNNLKRLICDNHDKGEIENKIEGNGSCSSKDEQNQTLTLGSDKDASINRMGEDNDTSVTISQNDRTEKRIVQETFGIPDDQNADEATLLIRLIAQAIDEWRVQTKMENLPPKVILQQAIRIMNEALDSLK